MTDVALERQIEGALAVEPSPEFTARVRARIAGEPAPVAWWQLRWPLFASVAGAAVAAFIAAAIWSTPSAPEQVMARAGNDIALTTLAQGDGNAQARAVRPSTAREDGVGSGSETPRRSSPGTNGDASQPAAAGPSGQTLSGPSAGRTLSRPSAGRTLSGPSAGQTLSGPSAGRTLSGPAEILISRDEQRGWELLLTAVRDGRITPALASQIAAADAAVETTDIAIADIVIPPLKQIAALEGEGQ